MTSASIPCSCSHFTCGYTGAAPTPPATNKHFFLLQSIQDPHATNSEATSERSSKITETDRPLLTSDIFMVEAPTVLEYNRDRSCFSVIITDCKRNPFPFIIHLYDHKLSRLTMTLQHVELRTSIRKILSASFSAFKILYMIFLLVFIYALSFGFCF